MKALLVTKCYCKSLKQIQSTAPITAADGMVALMKLQGLEYYKHFSKVLDKTYVCLYSAKSVETRH